MGRDTPLRACFEKVTGHEDGYKMAAELRTLYEADPDAKRVIDVARGLEGLRRQDGIHAAAVVITREPLTEYLPIQRKPEAGGKIEDAPIVTQYEMHGVEDLGLLKMDFLGLRNLDVLEIALDLIAERTGARPDIDRVPLDDAATFELLRRGDTVGVFQLEGGPMRALLRSLAPTEFEDVAALIALYRPGPMAQNWHNEYADRKNGRKPVTYPHDDLRGGPRAHLRADDLPGAADARRAAARRLLARGGRQPPQGHGQEDPRAHRARSAPSSSRAASPTATPRSSASDFFDMIEPFADYSFNKSHSFGYGFVTYQTAWLKANYPVEYFAALLTSASRPTRTRPRSSSTSAGRWASTVLVPDVNESVSDFSVRARPRGRGRATDPVRALGGAQRRRGRGRAHRRRTRRGRPVHRLLRLLRPRRPVGAQQAHASSRWRRRARSTRSATRARAWCSCTRRSSRPCSAGGATRPRASSTSSPRSTTPAPEAVVGHRTEIPDTEFPKSQRLAFEKEMLGLYVSDHPMMGAERALRKYVDCTLVELARRS